MKKKEYKIKKCLYCGGDIIRKKGQSIPAYKKRKFCTSSCQHKWNALNKSKDVKCDFCGKIIRKKKSHITLHNFCSLDCFRKWKHQQGSKEIKCNWCGKKFKKVKSQIGKHNFCSQKCMGEWQAKFIVGENSYNWNNGISTINHRIRSLNKYTDWRKDVFRRDNYTCQKCGDSRGGNLEAHHKKRVTDIIKDSNITNMADILKNKELWDINNGITLCQKCHIKIHKEESI